jgi:hypothetical protein
MDIESIGMENLEDIDRQYNINNFKSCLSDTETWGSWPNSPKILTSAGIESGMDELLMKLHKTSISTSTTAEKKLSQALKKRGRKPIRPNDPIKKKTEEKDKYWLRGFRGYMKTHYSEISDTLTSEEQAFWLDHLSSKGVPDKGNVYSSYGKKYKNHLFSQPSFVHHFQDWFHKYGEKELSRKCSPESDLWFVFFDYACRELVNYVPVGCSSQDDPDSPISCSSPVDHNEEKIDDPVDFCMVSVENDNLLNLY